MAMERHTVDVSLPPSSFAGEFRRVAIPVLARSCEVHGLFVALRLETVSQALAEVMAEAWRHDAAWLPEEHFEQLETWVMDTLLTAAAVKREAADARGAALAHVTDDVERWNAAVMEAFSG